MILHEYNLHKCPKNEDVIHIIQYTFGPPQILGTEGEAGEEDYTIYIEFICIYFNVKILISTYYINFIMEVIHLYILFSSYTS